VITEERLYEAAKRAGDAILAAQPGEEECRHQFSRRFEHKMRRLIRRTDHPLRYWAMQGVAAMLAVVLLGGGTVLAVSPKAREAFVGWVREIFDTHVSYTFVGEAGEGVPEGTVYRPSYIPEGYTAIQQDGAKMPLIDVYFNADTSRMLLFTYMEDTPLGGLNVADEDGSDTGLTEVTVGEYPADLHLDDGEDNSILTWHDPERKVRFTISAALPSEELIRIAESVTTEELTLTPCYEEYVLNWIPAGYDKSMSGYGDLRSGYVFEKEDRDAILVQYGVDPSLPETIAEQAGVETRHVQVDGTEAALYQQTDGTGVLVWNEPDSGQTFWVTAPLDEESLVRIAEGVMRAPGSVQRPYPPEGYQLLHDAGAVNTAQYVDASLRRVVTFSYEPANPEHPKGIGEAEGAERVLVEDRPADLFRDADGTHTLVYYHDYHDSVYTASGKVPVDELRVFLEGIYNRDYSPQYAAYPSPTWVPEGYEVQYVSPKEYRMNLAWRKGEIWLLYGYDMFAVGGDAFVPPADMAVTEIAVDGRPAQLYTDDTGDRASTLIWMNEKEDIHWITGHLSDDELLRMAESVAITE